MDLDHQAIRAGRDGCERERRHEVAPPARVARIHQHRQMRLPLEIGHGVDVEGIAKCAVECADAALAQHHLRVAARQDVFGGQKQIFERRRHAALEQHGLSARSHLIEQREVLHVARSHLYAVHLLSATAAT